MDFSYSRNFPLHSSNHQLRRRRRRLIQSLWAFDSCSVYGYGDNVFGAKGDSFSLRCRPMRLLNNNWSPTSPEIVLIKCKYFVLMSMSSPFNCGQASPITATLTTTNRPIMIIMVVKMGRAELAE